jgi:putative DNA primase/helicase
MHEFSTKPLYQQNLHPILARAPLTDLGNALRYFARFGSRLRWVRDRGVWLEWDKTRWAEDKDNIALSLAGETASMIVEESKAIRPASLNEEQWAKLTPAQRAEHDRLNERADSMLKWSLQSQNKGHLEAMLSMLKSEPGDFYRELFPSEYTRHKIGLADNQIDANDKLINFKNGSLHLDSVDEMILTPHDRYDFCMKQVPFDYEPDAQAPKWRAFIKKISQARDGNGWKEREDLELYIQAISGCGLYGTVIDEVLPVFKGFGGNGKSIYSEMMNHAIGDYGATATSDLFMAKQNEGVNNDVARLSGVRFLIAEETEEGKRLNEALVKQLTGGTTMTARFLRQEFFQFMPKFIAVMMTNHAPMVRGTDKGIWRRLKLVPWDYDFEQDPERRDRDQVMRELKEEAPGIINWLVEGLKYRLAVPSMEVLEPACVRDATAKYKTDSDILHQYIDEYMFHEDGAKIEKDNFYTGFAEWAKSSGFMAPSKRLVGQRLIERGWKDSRGTGGKRIWLEWRLRGELDPVPVDAPAVDHEI